MPMTMMKGNTSKNIKKSYLIGLLCLGYSQVLIAQCPVLVKHEVSYNWPATHESSLKFFLQNEDGSSYQAGQEKHAYNLWDKGTGRYLYNPSKLDAGFYEDKKIEVSLNNNVIEFKNVPEHESYFLVVFSQGCRTVLGPDGGVAVQESAR